jgi:3-methyladenine DNA glycosylase AlkD
MNVKLLHKTIRQNLTKRGNPKHAEKDKFYHRYEGYKSYGIKAAELDRILKQYKQQFKELTEPDTLTLAELLYSSRIEDEILAANYLLGLHPELIKPATLKYLDRFLDYFISWSTTDDFCIDVLQSFLLHYPKQTLAYLKRWNKSNNIWKRRASVVVFVRKIGESGKFTDEALALCNNLIHDEEDLVLKGVGWALKDVMRGDKTKVLKYVQNLRQSGVSAIVTLYALRDIKGVERATILKS